MPKPKKVYVDPRLPNEEHNRVTVRTIFIPPSARTICTPGVSIRVREESAKFYGDSSTAVVLSENKTPEFVEISGYFFKRSAAILKAKHVRKQRVAELRKTIKELQAVKFV